MAFGTQKVQIVESVDQLKWKTQMLTALQRIATALESLASTEDNRERLEEQMLGVETNRLDIERSVADDFGLLNQTLVEIENALVKKPGPAVRLVAKVGKEIPK